LPTIWSRDCTMCRDGHEHRKRHQVLATHRAALYAIWLHRSNVICSGVRPLLPLDLVAQHGVMRDSSPLAQKIASTPVFAFVTTLLGQAKMAESHNGLREGGESVKESFRHQSCSSGGGDQLSKNATYLSRVNVGGATLRTSSHRVTQKERKTWNQHSER